MHLNPTLVDRFFPFQGTWSFAWIVQRYLRSSSSAFTPRKLANAALAYSEMRLARPTVRSKPTVLRLEPCNACNLRCPNCACGTGRDQRKKGLMEMADLEYILKQTADSAIVARLDGMGEPTLHPEIFDMIRLIKSYNVSVSMSSNFDTRNCDKIEEFIDSGLDRLIVAVDGTTQDVYEKYRIGGNLERVAQRTVDLVAAKKRRGSRRPIVELQMLNLDVNRHQIPEMRRLASEWGVDRFTLTGADPTTKVAQVQLPKNPKRCFWLWYVLTVGWDLDYRSCTNAWSLPWPDLNMREVPVDEYWNHYYLQEARRFNKNKDSDFIKNCAGCKCSRCFEMLVAPMQGDYFCE